MSGTAHHLNCVGCGQAIEFPDAPAHPWADHEPSVVCPHCQRRNVNPTALQEGGGGARVEWLAVLGVLLVVAGLAGGVLQLFIVTLDEAFRAAMRRVAFNGFRVFATLVGFAGLTATGFLMIRAATSSACQTGRPRHLVVAMIFTVGVALGGLFYAFAGKMWE